MINPLTRATRGSIRIGTNNASLVLSTVGLLFFLGDGDRLFYALFDVQNQEQYEWIETSKRNFKYWNGSEYVSGVLKRWNGSRWV